MPEIKPIKEILRFCEIIRDKFRLANLLFNLNNRIAQEKKLTNEVENTNPLTPKFIGDISPHGLDPPIRNQSKNKFRNIDIIDILKGVFASSSP